MSYGVCPKQICAELKDVSRGKITNPRVSELRDDRKEIYQPIPRHHVSSHKASFLSISAQEYQSFLENQPECFIDLPRTITTSSPFSNNSMLGREIFSPLQRNHVGCICSATAYLPR